MASDQADVKQYALRPRDSVIFHVESLAPNESRRGQFLASTDIGVIGMHTLRAGETLELLHDHLDSFLFVKSGKAKFSTGESESRIVSAGDGIRVPIGCPHRFEAISSPDGSDFQFVQFVSSDETLPERMSEVKRGLGLS